VAAAVAVAHPLSSDASIGMTLASANAPEDPKPMPPLELLPPLPEPLELPLDDPPDALPDEAPKPCDSDGDPHAAPEVTAAIAETATANKGSPVRWLMGLLR
jgi:hypothetical protein